MLWSKINRNVVYRCSYSYRQRVCVITRFPNIFFVLFLHIQRLCKSFWKERSDAYKQLICIMQRVHCQVRVGVFSCQDKYLFRYLWYCGKKKQIECGLAWSVLLSTTIRVITMVKMLCNKLSYITKRALCFSYWVHQCSIHPWANSRCWISQSERALCFSYVIIMLKINYKFIYR